MCRNKAFWLMDAIKGGNVRKYLQLLKNCEDGKWTDDEIENYQYKKTIKLLQHCRSTVPFYKSQTSINLIDWPVVKKATFKNGYEQFLSSSTKKKT